MKTYPVAIIGLGPGGLTAAIYLKRLNIPFLALERKKVGGKIRYTESIQNYPSFSGTGEDLADSFKRQLEDNKIEVTYDEVQTIQKIDDVFKIQANNNIYQAETVLVATGIREKEFKIKGQDSFNSRGISRCAICDGPLFKKKTIAVYGSNNTAVIEANYLATISPLVYFISDEEIKAEEEELKLLKSKENVRILLKKKIVEVGGTRSIESITLLDENNETETLEVGGLFLYVGAAANTSFLPFPEIFNEKKQIITDSNMSTPLPGLFAVGDIRNTPLKQVITAASDGAIAAISISNYLKRKS